MLECSSVWWDLYCGKSEWAFSWSISSARGSPVRGGTSMAAPEAGRGFSHCRTHLRSRHNAIRSPHGIILYPQRWTFTTSPLSHTQQAEQQHFILIWAWTLIHPRRLRWTQTQRRASPLSPLAWHSDLSCLACCLQPSPPLRGRCAFAPYRQEDSALRICTEPQETQGLFLTQALCTEWLQVNPRPAVGLCLSKWQ